MMVTTIGLKMLFSTTEEAKVSEAWCCGRGPPADGRAEIGGLKPFTPGQKKSN